MNIIAGKYGMYTLSKAKIQDNHVYRVNDNGELLLPQKAQCAEEVADDSLRPFEDDGKWGFARYSTGEIKIQPQWDYAGEFCGKLAHVANGIQVDIERGYFSEGGKHGYIDVNGNTVIPLIYEDAKDCPENISSEETDLFCAKKDGKWGLIDCQNKTIIPFLFLEISGLVNRNFYLTAIGNYKEIRFGVYTRNCEELIPPVLDELPKSIRLPEAPEVFINYETLTYYYVKTGRRFGVISSDGRMITDLTLLKKDAVALIKKLSGY